MPSTVLPASSSRSLIFRGSSGDDVTALQRLLLRAGFDTGGIDGDFGPRTRAAVVAFQRANGLTPDGRVGPETWAALRRAPAATTPEPRGANDGIMELHPGSHGNSVLKLQQALQAAGFDPGPLDGKFGPTTDAAVRRFQASRELDVDGVVGAATWRALRGQRPSGDDFGDTTPPRVDGVTPPPPANDAELRARILEVAQGEIGTIEATNRNDGAVLKYPRYFGRGSEAWCDDFVSWVNTHAGNPMNDYNCETTRRTMVAEGRWKGQRNPQPGDIVLFDWDGDRRADHIGILKSVNRDGTFTTIEGNTSSRGHHEGVWERTRTLDTILGFGNPV